MARLHAVIPRAAICCLLAGACEGNGALFPSGLGPAPSGDDAPAPQEDVAPLTPVPEPSRPSAENPQPPVTLPPVTLPPVPSVPSVPVPDAGAPETPPDASPVAVPPRDVVAEGAAIALSLLGVAGGDPRLGVCTEGVIVGVRTTANPSLEVFGQRLTFVEPICGQVQRDPSGTLRVTRDDALVAWSVTDGFFGLPATEVPDPRLVWVRQPETVCPEATPVVVGLAGDYDPVAPDVPDTAAIRSLFVECAPLVIAPDGIAVSASAAGHQLLSNAEAFAAPGGESYRSACEGGSVTTRLQIHAGFWLDGIVIGCSSLRVE